MSPWRFGERLAAITARDAHASVLGDASPGSSTWEILQALDTAGPLPAGTVDARINDLAACLAAERPTLLTLLLRPQDALAAVPDRANRPADWTPELWLWMCWLAEAAWLALDRISVGRRANPRQGEVADRQPRRDPNAQLGPARPDRTVDPTFTATDADLLRPLAARLRMITLTEPVRAEAWRVDPISKHRALVTRAFGTDTLHELVSRAQQARATWLGFLNAYQSHLLLVAMAPEDIEREVKLVVFADGRRTALIISELSYLSGSAKPLPYDSAVAMEAVERHLLPRMMVAPVVGLASRIRYGRAVSALALAAALAALAATVAGWLAWHPAGLRPSWYQIAALTATVAYVVVACGSWRLGQLWSAQWLLRLPAAAAVGLFVLVTLHPAWMYRDQRPGAVVALLPAAAMGYLLVEAGNHGVSRRRAIGRAALVTTAGAAHALLVSLVGLVLVAPAFVENGPEVAKLWQAGQGWPGLRALLLAAAWCLAVGVFSQILWDDRPITAPLAHLSWRDGR